MITVVRIDNPFEPFRRETSEVEFEKGMTTADICREASVDDLVAGAVGHNGGFLGKDESRTLEDGDFVTILVAPGGGWGVIFEFIVKAWIFGKIAQSLMPKMDQPPDPDSTYGYQGFSNSYTPEGTAAPLVYGTMRVAPPCINQSIIGGEQGVSSEQSFGTTETLNAMYLLSEGPIFGLGDYILSVDEAEALGIADVDRGRVESDADQNVLEINTDVPNVPSGLGLQINGIDGQALDGSYMWRTGHQYQEAIHGSNGYLDFTNPSTTYSLGFAVTIGTDGINGSSGEFPSAIVVYDDRIIDSDTTQYVSQQLTEKADLLNIQAFFPQGLFSDHQDGTPDAQTVRIRAQYWRTDSSGTATSDVYILPPIVITRAITNPFSIDFRTPLNDPATIAASSQGGWFWVNRNEGSGTPDSPGSGAQEYSGLNNQTGLQQLVAGVGSHQQFSGALWVLPANQIGNDAAMDSPLMCWNMTTTGDFHNLLLFAGTGIKTWAPQYYNDSRKGGWAFAWSRYQNSSDDDIGYGLVLWGIGIMPDVTEADGQAYERWTMQTSDLFTGESWTGNSTNWFHAGFAYQGGGSGSWGQSYTGSVTFYINGVSYTAVRDWHGYDVPGSTINQGEFQSRATWPTGTTGTGGMQHKFFIGHCGDQLGDDSDERCTMRISQAVLYKGLLSNGWFSNAYNQVDLAGNRNFDVKTMEGDPNLRVCLPMRTHQGGNGVPNGSRGYYINYAYPDATTEEGGTIEMQNSWNQSPHYRDAPNSNAPTWTTDVAEVAKDYYKVEVFKDKGGGPYDDYDRQDSVTIDSITAFSTQDYVYPSSAVLSTSIEATEEVNNSTPQMTMIVHGLLVPVCTDASGETPTIQRQFSNNPAWVALDLLTNSNYGMGSIFSPDGTYELIDLQSFVEWADFCDEGTEDGHGEVFFYGLRTDNELASAENPAGPGLYLYIGIEQDGVTMQTLPSTWKVGGYVSIKTCIDAIPDFVTANDVKGGLNDASNRMEIHSINSYYYADPSATYSGGVWNTFYRVNVKWNRFNENGNYVFPEGNTTGTYFWADDLTNASTTLDGAITATAATAVVDDISIFQGLDFDPASTSARYYATIEDEIVQIYDIALDTDTILILRGQQGTTAATHADNKAITLKAGAALGAVSGFETRCSFDGVFDQKNTAGWDALLQVFQTGRAMPVKAGARIIAVVDKPRDPVSLFTQANIKEGSLALSYLGVRDKPNSIVSSFLNADRNYEKDTAITDHPSTWKGAGTCSIDHFTDEISCVAAGGTWTADDLFPASFATRRQENLEARGVVRRSQATRDSTYRLNRYHLQRRAATFEVGPDSIHLLPGDRILVSHDTPQYGYSGRIPEGGTWNNNYPSGGPDSTDVPNIYEAFSDPGDTEDSPIPSGGSLWKGQSNMANILQPAGDGATPPLTEYTSPVTMFRGSIMDGTGHLPAGNAASGYPTATFDADKNNTGGGGGWAEQFGYPGDSAIYADGVDIDVIESTTHKSCWSVYVKEPSKGASRGLLLNLYRRYDKDFGTVNRSMYGYFRWIAGALTVVGVSGTDSAAITAAVDSTYASPDGWYRASVTIDWSKITSVTPAEAVGDHIQARFYSYDYQNNGNNGYDSASVKYGLWKGVSVAADGNSVTWDDADNDGGSCSVGSGAHTTRAACNAAGGTWTGTVRRGRGRQFLAYGDPMELEDNLQWDGDADGTATDAWPLVNNVPGADPSTTNDNRIWSGPSSGSAPPFYPEAVKPGAGGTETPNKYGMVQHIWAGKEDDADKLSFKQVIDLNATTSSGTSTDPAPTGGSNWLYHFDRFNGRDDYGVFSDEPMILSFFFKRGRFPDQTCKLQARLMFDDSVDSNGLANGDYAEVAITLNTSGSPSFAYSLNNASGASHPGTISWAQYNTTGATTYSGDATYAEKVRQNSTTSDSDWYYVRIAAVNDTDFRDTSTGYSGHLGVQFIMGSSTGSDCTAGNTAGADIWGVNLRGLGGDSTTEGGCLTTVRYYTLDDTSRYRGHYLWGMMYENGVDEPSAFSVGSSIKLDRDVSVEAGKEYEIYVRSSSTTNPVLATDAQEVLGVSTGEVPASGTTVIPARQAIDCASPTLFVPATGDIYAFGETGKTTEDFYITSIDTDPNTLVRTIECIEYNEGIYNDANWSSLGDPSISSLPSPGGDENAEYAMGGGGGPSRQGLNMHLTLDSYRGPSGEPTPAVWVRWGSTSSSRSFEKVRFFISLLTTDDLRRSLDIEDSVGIDWKESQPQLVATVPSSEQAYRYSDPTLLPSRRYRIRMQPVGWKGTAMNLRKCPYQDFVPVIITPLPSAPTVAATLRGKKQMYKVAQTGTARDYAIEGRIGGWIVSTPAWIIDPNTDRFVSEGLLPVPTNAAGSTQATVYARPKLLNGSYGNATTVTGTEAMVDVRASRQLIGEDDYAAAQASITLELQIVAGTTDILQWNTSSTSVAEQSYKMTALDATTPRRTVVNAIIGGYQERPETFADFRGDTLGGEVGRNWSIEGPMQDDGYNGSVEIQWRWTSGGTITGEDFRPFEPGEIYARKVQFMLVFNRSAITGLFAGTGYAQTKVTRFTVIENDQPNEHFVDGGTF